MSPVLPLVLGGASSVWASRWVVRHAGIPEGTKRWVRHNHRGHEVTLTEGVALVVGTAVSLAVVDPVGALTALGSGLTGAVDDLNPDAARKGLAGHLGALVRGDLSIGALKVLSLTGCGLLAAAADQRAAGRRAPRIGPSQHHRVRAVGDAVVRAGVVASSANLANLLDLRPGRALKVTLLTGIPLSAVGAAQGRGTEPAAVAVGAALILLPMDLRAEGMLGDTGANAVGALLGLATTRAVRPPARAAVLAGLVGLTLASERVSFTRVIESTPVLRELDAWGRRGR